MPAFSGAETVSIARGAGSRRGSIDCHTHLVYGGNRAREFELRLTGATYEQIAKAGRRNRVDGAPDAWRQRQKACCSQALPAPRRADRRRRDHQSRSSPATVSISRPSGRCSAWRADSAAERIITVSTTFPGRARLPPEAASKDEYIDDDHHRRCCRPWPQRGWSTR